jgi:membrane protease YdiL (CAAX protease family)
MAQAQNFKNHTRRVKGFHGALFILIVLFFGGALNYWAHASEDNYYLASLLVILAPILILLMWFTRTFALKAQDRAIRAEENFRHYLLTQKPLPSSLRLSQIIALRFASDQEYLELVEQAVKDKLPAKEIKAKIKNWKGDYHRV